MNHFPFSIAVVFVAAISPTGRADDGTKYSAVIARLGSSSTDEREAAAKELRKYPDALGELYAAVSESKSGDVRRAATDIIRGLEEYDPAKCVKLLAEYVKKKQFDRAMEVCVTCRESLTAEDGVFVLKMRDDILAFAEAESKLTVPAKLKTLGDGFKGMVVGKEIDASVIVKAGFEQFRTFACGEKITFDWMVHVCAVSSEGIVPVSPKQRAATALSFSLLFSDSSTKVSSMSESIVLVNGDIGPDRILWSDQSVILCTGSVLDLSPVDKSIVIAGGKIDMQGQVQRCKESALVADCKNIKTHFDFFDTAKDGLVLNLKEKQLVAEVTKGRYRDVGLLTGDVVLEVNGKGVSTPAEVNRLLCRSVVTTGHAVIKLRREKDVKYVYLKLQG